MRGDDEIAGSGVEAMFALFTISLVVCFLSVVGSYALEGQDFAAKKNAGRVADGGSIRLGELW